MQRVAECLKKAVLSGIVRARIKHNPDPAAFGGDVVEKIYAVRLQGANESTRNACHAARVMNAPADRCAKGELVKGGLTGRILESGIDDR